MAKKESQIHTSDNTIEPILQVWAWIVIAWAVYRYYMHLPEWVDEFVFKPLVFVMPVLWYVRKKEKRSFSSIGLTLKHLLPSIGTGILFGVVFVIEGAVAQLMRSGSVQIRPLEVVTKYGAGMLFLLSLATAFSEEILNRGFLFNRIYERKKNLWYAVILSALMFVFLHVPILVTSLKFTGLTLILYFFTDLILGMATALLFASSGSLVAPILVHVFWNMTVALFL